MKIDLALYEEMMDELAEADESSSIMKSNRLDMRKDKKESAEFRKQRKNRHLDFKEGL